MDWVSTDEFLRLPGACKGGILAFSIQLFGFRNSAGGSLRGSLAWAVADFGFLTAVLSCSLFSVVSVVRLVSRWQAGAAEPALVCR